MAKIDRNVPDIPDFNERELPQAVLSAEVLGERNVRRYIRKDGVFNKDFEHFFDNDTGKFDSGGRIIYEATKTIAEAQAFITELCENTGRKVVIDSLSGRPRAEPGWNLDIRVPGMGQSEQKAPTVPEGVMRERINNQLLIDQRNQINELAQTVAYLTAQLAPKPEGQAAADKEVAAADRKKVKAAAEAKANGK